MHDAISVIIAKYNYWVYVVLMMIGLYAMIVKKYLIKKISGMSIMQTAIIFFYVSIGVKKGATIPIVSHGVHDASAGIQAAGYINPLPHVLMLTAIVVAVATLGVALALALKVYHYYNTLEEDEICARIRNQTEEE